jgi:hypothetical protein
MHVHFRQEHRDLNENADSILPPLDDHLTSLPCQALGFRSFDNSYDIALLFSWGTLTFRTAESQALSIDDGPALAA